MDRGVGSSQLSMIREGQVLRELVADFVVLVCYGAGPFVPWDHNGFTCMQQSGNGELAGPKACFGGDHQCLLCGRDGCELYVLSVSDCIWKLHCRGHEFSSIALYRNLDLSWVSYATAVTGVCNAYGYSQRCGQSLPAYQLRAARCSTVHHFAQQRGLECTLRATQFFFHGSGGLCNDYPAIFNQDLICDAMPGRSAGMMLPLMLSLQRQSVLPVVYGLTNGQTCASCLWGRGTNCSSHCAESPGFRAGKEVDSARTAKLLCEMLHALQYHLDLLIQHLFFWFWTNVQCMGHWWQQAFIFLAAVIGRHLCQLYCMPCS